MVQILNVMQQPSIQKGTSIFYWWLRKKFNILGSHDNDFKECTKDIRDILLNLNHIDLNKLDNKSQKKKILNKLNVILKLDIENKIENKIDKNYGARHAKSFTDLIKNNGILNEVLLILRTKGLFNIIELAKLLPIAISAQLAGKRPPFLSHSSKNKNQIKKIFKKLEDK